MFYFHRAKAHSISVNFDVSGDKFILRAENISYTSNVVNVLMTKFIGLTHGVEKIVGCYLQHPPQLRIRGGDPILLKP